MSNRTKNSQHPRFNGRGWSQAWIEQVAKSPWEILVELDEPLRPGSHIKVEFSPCLNPPEQMLRLKEPVTQKAGFERFLLIDEWFDQDSADALSTALKFISKHLQLSFLPGSPNVQALCFLVSVFVYTNDEISAYKGMDGLLWGNHQNRSCVLDFTYTESHSYLSQLRRVFHEMGWRYPSSLPFCRVRSLIGFWHHLAADALLREEQSEFRNQALLSYWTIPPIIYTYDQLSEQTGNTSNADAVPQVPLDYDFANFISPFREVFRQAKRLGAGISVDLRMTQKQDSPHNMLPHRPDQGAEASTLSSSTKANVFLHSPDYRSVLMKGKPFCLTAKQAEVIQELHEAATSRLPAVSQAYIIAEIYGSDSKYPTLKKAFGDNTVYEALICQGPRKGTVQLNV